MIPSHWSWIRTLGLALRQRPAAGVLLVGVLAAVGLAAMVARKCDEWDRLRLDQDAALLAGFVKLRFDSHRDGLIALRVALEGDAAQNWVTFSNQVEMLYPSENYPAFAEFAYLHRTYEELRARFPGVTRDRAHAQFDLRYPGGQAQDWISFPVLYHHFVRPHDQPPPGVFTNWGLDLYQDPEERDRLRWAWGADRPSVTRGGPSVWGDGPPQRVRIYLPVMERSGEASDFATMWERARQRVESRSPEWFSPTELQRSTRAEMNFSRLQGIVAGALNVERLLANSFPDNAPPLAVRIRDETGPILAGEMPDRARRRTTRKERYYGRDWHFDFATTPTWEAASLRWYGWTVLAVGVTLSAGAAVAIGSVSLGRERDRAARVVAERQSRDLGRARDDLHAAQAARAQLQRNLHDAVLQRLYAAALHARINWQTAARGEPVRVADLGMQVSELDEAMIELRTYLGGSTHRAPSGPDLLSALKGLARTFERQTGVAVRTEIDPGALARLPDGSGDHVLQTVREGLSNARRHGRATVAVVRIVSHGTRIRLSLEDNGTGFDPATGRTPGRGLANLAERATLGGGRFRVESSPGGPTTLTMEWDCEDVPVDED